MSHGASTALAADEEQAVRAVMDGIQRAWRERDVSGYVAHFAEDADLVNRNGAWWRGKADIQQRVAWLAEHAMPEIFAAATAIEAVRPIAPGVVTVHQRREEPARTSLATYVLAKVGGRWLVQSVAIAPVEPSPGVRPSAS